MHLMSASSWGLNNRLAAQQWTARFAAMEGTTAGTAVYIAPSGSQRHCLQPGKVACCSAQRSAEMALAMHHHSACGRQPGLHCSQALASEPEIQKGRQVLISRVSARIKMVSCCCTLKSRSTTGRRSSGLRSANAAPVARAASRSGPAHASCSRSRMSDPE